MQRRTTNDWDIAINGFSTMNGDPAFFLAWATGPTTFGYANQQVKDLVAKALETPDDTQRASVLQQAEKLYWADVPYLWGYTQTDTIAIRKEVSGVTPLSTGWVLFQTATIAG
jgi:ABC-type transport system substrate-binding protein